MKNLTYKNDITKEKVIGSSTYGKGVYIDDCDHIIEELTKGAQIQLHKTTDYENNVCSAKVTIFFFPKKQPQERPKRTQTEKIEKFISEYETKIERCYEKIKEVKEELKAERNTYRSAVAKSMKKQYSELLIHTLKKNLAVQEKKLMILVQAKSDFECCL